MGWRRNLEDEEDSGDWIVTFADLMALLLAFFVLLFSFSKVDEHRYEELANSFSASFSLLSTQSASPSLDNSVITPFPTTQPIKPAEKKRESVEDLAAKALDEIEISLKQQLSGPVQNGELTIRRDTDQIVLELPSDNSFASGSADLSIDVEETLELLARTLGKTRGRIVVSGHTDNLPINGGRYASNWDLSAARAASVTNYLLSFISLDPKRFQVAGFADTQPLVINSTVANRAINRRVEIALLPPES